MLRVDNATLKKRVKDIEALLKEENLEGLVIYANGSALGSASRAHGYLRYLVNFDGHNTSAILVLRPGHEPSLVSSTNPFNIRVLLRELLWFKDVRTTKAPAMGQEVVAIFGEGSSGTKRHIGYIGINETPVPVWKAIEKGLPNVEWVDFSPVFDQQRVQKDDIQLAFHRRAGEICDAIFQTVQRDVRKGLKTYQLQAAMEHTARYEGAEYCLSWLTVGPKADYSRFYKEECLRVPQEGDQVLPGIYLTYDGHWGHAIRTGTVGKPTDDHRKTYDIVREMYEEFLNKLKPGEDLREAVAVTDKVVYKYYREEDVDRARPGHGLGFSYEDPIVTNAFFHPWEFKNRPAPGTSPIELKPGMLMELHPNLYVPNVAGAMIGDMVAITDTGYEILTEYPRDLIVY
jgi:Xaa-Pro aminopeptidase